MWGYNIYGECTIPTELQGPGKVKQISLGGYHSAAIDMNDELYMWGRNTYGQCNIPTEIKNTITNTYTTISDYIHPKNKIKGNYNIKIKGVDIQNISSNTLEYNFEKLNNIEIKKNKHDSSDIYNLNYIFKWYHTSGELNHYEIKLDDGVWTDAGTDISYIWENIIVNSHTFSVKAFDKLNNESNILEWSFNKH
jgi:hypothetical protein